MADFDGDEVADEMIDMDETEGGGYVDDELDVDDEFDGEGDVNVFHEHATVGSSTVGPGGRRAASAAVGSPHVEDPRDYVLMATGDDQRQIIVARFLTPCPDLAPPSRMRALRDGERNTVERLEAIKAEKRQLAYENSHIGKTRRMKRNRQGYIDIPERDRKRWTFDTHSPNENEMNSTIVSADHRTQASDTNTDGASTNNVFDPDSSDTRQFMGTFEGKSSSRYAILLVDERAHTANVVPVGPYAWYSMRQKRGRRPFKEYTTTEGAELAMRRKAMVGKDKITKFQEKAEEAHEKTEIRLGTMNGIRAKKEEAGIVPLRRRGPRPGSGMDGEGEAEGLDFEQEFDNDDVAQIDLEEVDKDDEAREVRGDRDTNEKKFRQLIKDEVSIANRTGSPASASASDSDEEDEATSLEALTGMLQKAAADGSDKKSPQHPRSSPKSSSGSRPHSPSQSTSPKRSPGHTSAGTGLPPRAPTSRPSSQGAIHPNTYVPRPGSSRLPTPLTGSPGPSSAPSTPLRQEYAHLLPPPGTLPQTKHVVDVLSLMLRNRQNQPVPLKEFTRAFERITTEQKKNLASIMKQVAQLTELQPGSKVYYVSLRNPDASTPTT